MPKKENDVADELEYRIPQNSIEIKKNMNHSVTKTANNDDKVKQQQRIDKKITRAPPPRPRGMIRNQEIVHKGESRAVHDS